MTKKFRIIRDISIAIVLILVVSIIHFFISIGSVIFGKFSNHTGEKILLSEVYKVENVKEIFIELENTDIEIKQGTQLKVESNNKKVELENNDGVLKIYGEKNKFRIFKINSLKNKYFIRIYLPDIIFEKLSIKSGVGEINIDKFSCNYLLIENGAGKLRMRDVAILDNVKLSSGVGKSDIIHSNFNNAELNLGVGKFSFNGTLSGKTDVSVGVGSVELTLDDINNYKMFVNKGVGSITLSGNSVSNGVYGNGNNIINVDGGVGSLSIR